MEDEVPAVGFTPTWKPSSTFALTQAMAAPPLSAAPSGAAPPVSSSRKPRVSHVDYLPAAQTIRVLQCRTRQRRPRSRKFTGDIQSEDENLCFSIEPTAI